MDDRVGARRLNTGVRLHARAVMPRVGLISDTHGLLRTEAVTFLRGSDFIVHAGDVGDVEVLDQLASLAPVTVECYELPGKSAVRTSPLRLTEISYTGAGAGVGIRIRDGSGC